MDFANDCKRCEECEELSKRVSGLWDGVDENGNDVSGCFYVCDNSECAIKQERDRKISEGKSERLRTIEQNEAAGTDSRKLRKMRRDANCTLRTAAEIAGISVGEYSAMECERQVIPMNIFEGMRFVFMLMQKMRENGRK